MSGHDVALDISNFEGYTLHNGFELTRIFNIAPKIAPTEKSFKEIKKNKIEFFLAKIGLSNKIIIQRNFGCIPPYLNYSKSKYWKGYWQSEKFFSTISKTIRSDFEFPEYENNTKKIAESFKQKNTVSLHVRRGDYLTSKLMGNICDIVYYQNAIQIISEKIDNPYYVVFSDDPEWCKENLKINNSTYITNNSGSQSFRDMQLMSECQHNIIANSSFSWWAAWLNKNEDKIVIRPKKWFNDNGMNIDDLTPPNWVHI